MLWGASRDKKVNFWHFNAYCYPYDIRTSIFGFVSVIGVHIIDAFFLNVYVYYISVLFVPTYISRVVYGRGKQRRIDAL